MTVAQLIVACRAALEHYEDGDAVAALAALEGIHADRLPDAPEWVARELERRADVCGRFLRLLAIG